MSESGKEWINRRKQGVGCGRRRARRDLAPVPEPPRWPPRGPWFACASAAPVVLPDARVPPRRTEKVSNLRRAFFELRSRGNNITRFRSLTVNTRVCECDSSWMLFQPAGTSTSVGGCDRPVCRLGNTSDGRGRIERRHRASTRAASSLTPRVAQGHGVPLPSAPLLVTNCSARVSPPRPPRIPPAVDTRRSPPNTSPW